MWLWSEGDVRGARRLLRTLTEETTRNVRHTLAEYASRRKTLRLAIRHATRDPRVEAGSRVALTGVLTWPAVMEFVDTVDALVDKYFYERVEVLVSSPGGLTAALDHVVRALERWRAQGVVVDTDAAKDLLDMDHEQIPFRYDYVLSNRVLDFMRYVLADELPHASQSSLHSPGHYWGDGEFQSLRHFHEMHPEFGGEARRPLIASDFCDDGLVPSRVMRQAVKAGLPPSEIGNARVEEFGCADGPNYFVSIRRPLFLFAELRNASEEPVVFSSLIARSDEKYAFVRKLSSWGTGHLLTIDHNNLTLNPGEVLLVPECVLLSGQSHDPVHTEFEVESRMSAERVQSVGYSGAGDSSDFYVIGPASKIEGYKLIVGHDEFTAAIHPFELEKCYLYLGEDLKLTLRSACK